MRPRQRLLSPTTTAAPGGKMLRGSILALLLGAISCSPPQPAPEIGIKDVPTEVIIGTKQTEPPTATPLPRVEETGSPTP